jgi:hypothetical protein
VLLHLLPQLQFQSTFLIPWFELPHILLRMSPTDDTPFVTRVFRCLDWWFTPPWRALLTWTVFAGASGFVDDHWWDEWIGPAIILFHGVAVSLAPAPFTNIPFWVPQMATQLLQETFIEPFALRLSLPRSIAWIAIRIAASLSFSVFHPSVTTWASQVSGKSAYYFIREAWPLLWSVVLIPVLCGWRTRPWMCVLAVAASALINYLVPDSLYESIWTWRALHVIPYSAILLFGTRLLTPEERERQTCF